MGLDVSSYEFWRLNQLYPGKDGIPMYVVPEWLRTGLWMWRDEF